MHNRIKYVLALMLCIVLLTGCQAAAADAAYTPTAYITETIPETQAPTTCAVKVPEPTEPELTAPAESVRQPSAVPLLSEMEQQVLELMNEHRAQAGVNPLKMAYAYYDCAQIRARECLINWSHTRPDGRRSYSVYADLELEDGLLLCGENLARHFRTAEDMVQALMESPSHKRNIVNPNYQYVAISIVPVEGYDGLYAMAQLFIQKEE